MLVRLLVAAQVLPVHQGKIGVRQTGRETQTRHVVFVTVDIPKEPLRLTEAEKGGEVQHTDLLRRIGV